MTRRNAVAVKSCHKIGGCGVLSYSNQFSEGDIRMFRLTVLTAIAISIFVVGNASAQQLDQRTQSLVAALDKTKYKKKEKKGLSFELYVDVKNTAAVRSNPSEYSGLYDSDQNRLELNVASNGAATGSGYDDLNNGAGTVK